MACVRLLALLTHLISGGPLRPASLGPSPMFPGDELLTPQEDPAGIQIGNLTSQAFANLCLDRFDHWVIERWRPLGYQGYVYDLWFFDRDKGQLWALAEAIGEQLAALRLQQYPNRLMLRRAGEKLPVLGCQLWRDGAMRFSELNQRVRSWHGHAMHAETAGLRRAVFGRNPLRSKEAGSIAAPHLRH